MKLRTLTVFRHMLPVKGGGYRMANAFVERLETTIVRLESDCGVIGWGETCPVGPTYAPSHAAGAQAALQALAPGLMGTAIDQPVLVQRRMDSLLNGHNYAKAAIDIAVHDLLGKKTGRSVEIYWGALLETVFPLTMPAPSAALMKLLKLLKKKPARATPECR